MPGRYGAIREKTWRHFRSLPVTSGHFSELRGISGLFGAVRGVGGIDSWGADVEEQYHIPADRDIEFSFSLN